jgi:hypothetical protein
VQTREYNSGAGQQKQARKFPAETLAQRVARIQKELTRAASQQFRQRLRKEARRRERRQRRRPTTAAIAHLRARTWRHLYATKVQDVGVRPRLRKAQFIAAWNTRKSGARLSNYQLEQHFAGQATHYFCACPNKRTERALLMIDIDVQKSQGTGSAEGARDFAQHLRSRWPDLYVEPSTHGLGQHGYIDLFKLGRDAEQVRDAAKHLEQWLRQEAADSGADIEMVEVKGLPPVATYDAKTGQMTSIKYGTWAKLPRDVSRFREWQKTTCLTPEAIRALPIRAPEPQAARTKARKGTVPGSVSGRNVSDEELNMLPHWQALVRLYDDRPLRHGRYAITATDVALALVVLRFITANMNADGSLPHERVERLWTSLYEAGDFARPFNCHRWAAVRDWLSARGWVEWEDERYYFSTLAPGSGQAAKWRLEAGFMAGLDAMVRAKREREAARQEKSASFTVTAELPRGPGMALRPVLVLNGRGFDRQVWLEAEEFMNRLGAA